MGPPVDPKIPNSTRSLPSKASANGEVSNGPVDEQNAVHTTKPTRPALSATDSSLSATEESKLPPSREMSPARPHMRSQQNKITPVSRSRGGSQDVSPSRGSLTPTSNLPSVPSAAAVQRALSATRIPHLQQTNSDSGPDSFRGDKTNGTKSDDPPQWPISPRLKSPPPTSRMTPPATRKSEANLSSGPTPKPNVGSTPEVVRTAGKPIDRDESQQSANHRSGRGASTTSTLETVAEGSLPSTPLPGPESNSFGFSSATEPANAAVEAKASQTSKTESAKEGSESGGESGSGKSKSSKSEDREAVKANLAMTASRPPSVSTKRSFTTLNPSKFRPGAEPASRNMTVETETVSSIPQVSLGGGAADRGVSGRMESGGSVRLKPSNETIRPKKDKKKVARKPNSVNAGTVSSKADIFEAKVASAVDEASSSDSDETFVYESNPPDSHTSRQLRHHSRTPSTASMASQADGTTSRYRSAHKEGQQSIAGKRSMKFTNSVYSNNFDGDTSTGSVKGSNRGGSATPRHHHIGRHGRGGHASLFDNDSPFTQAGRASSTGKGAQMNVSRLSRPSSPRVNGFRNSTPTKKSDLYDQDFDDEAADDERTPLVGSVRINRSRHARRPNSTNLRQVEYFEPQDRGYLGRYGACIIIALLLVVLILGAATFVVVLTKPLADVSIKRIQNVLASEQEIILDLNVRARNPNLFAVTVSDLNVDIFAKSGYVSTIHREAGASVLRSGRRTFVKHRTNESEAILPTSTADGGVDEGTDPIEDPRTMLLGRIYEFDSPLIFEASPLHRKYTSSIGQVRLPKPGNKTEQGGTARWERVLQHSFELTVRGNIKYQLPLTSRPQSAQIQGSTKVSPDDLPDEEPSLK